MKLNPFAVAVPALLALAACNAPGTDQADLTGTSEEALNAEVRYIVAFKANQGPARAALASAGAKVAMELPSVNAAAVTLPARAVAALQNNPNFEYVEEDAPRYMLSQAVPYGITMTQADVASAANTGPTSKKVCIIDSGVYTSHEDLGGSPNSFSGYNGNLPWNVDGCGHGSHVSGTIAALNNATGVVGVNAKGVSIYMVRVFGDDCAWAYSSTLVDAAERCLQAGANVVSMSLGGGAKSRAEETEFNKLANNNVLSIAAAGNDGTTRLSYPASYPILMSVAALDSTKTIATFSQHNREVDIAAPGVAVQSTVPWFADNSATANGVTYTGGAMDGAASTAGTTAALVDGGLCTAAGSWSGKVVLCQRGTNTFGEKVANAKSGGGVAAIVYNNVSGGFAGTLNGTSTIPAITLSMEDGTALKASSLGAATTVKSLTTKPGSGYESWDGTSMATPHVSGIAALIWSAYPTKTAAQVRTALEATAQDLGTAGRDDFFGKGLVQANAARTYLGSH